MQTVSVEHVTKDWRKIVAEAERAPVLVHGGGVPDALTLSGGEYAHFRKARRVVGR